MKRREALSCSHVLGMRYRKTTGPYTAAPERVGPRRHGNRSDGAALVLALLLIGFLGIVVAELTHSSAVAAKLQRNENLALQNVHAAQGGLHVALATLIEDGAGDDQFDSLNEPWASPITVDFGPSQVTVEIVDEESKINPNFVPANASPARTRIANQVQRLAEALGISDGRLGQSVADWVDTDVKGPYDSEAGSKPMVMVNDLLWMPIADPQTDGHIDAEAIAALLPHLTVWSSGQVNINTAPAPVLMALLPPNAQHLVSNILNYRRTNDFESVADVQKVPGFSQVSFSSFAPHIKTRSDVFRIDVSATQGTAEFYAHAIVRRADRDVTVLLWCEGRPPTRGQKG